MQHRTSTCRLRLQSGLRAVAILVACAVLAPVVLAQVPARVETVAVAGPVHMLRGNGGNIGVLVGVDGAILVDDQYAPATPAILAAVKQLTDQPVRFVINSHWHQDHTGGNENLGELGAVIVAHENVRRRMSAGQFMEAFQREVPPAPPGALPVITFGAEVTFHWNGEEVHVTHAPRAHTDGDSIVVFRNANVVHMGDIFFHGLYPFIDLGSGGSIDGVIAAVAGVLPLLNDASKVIPGHGPLATRTELRAYHDMLVDLRGAIAKLHAEGKSIDEIVAAKPTAAYDERLGGGFIKPDALVRTIHASLQRAGK